MGNIQVYKMVRDLEGRKTEKQSESGGISSVEIQQLEIRTLEIAADRAESRQLSLTQM